MAGPWPASSAILVHDAVAVAAQLRGDLDPLEAAGGDVVVELDAGVAAEVAGDELGDRLADDQADRLVAVAA